MKKIVENLTKRTRLFFTKQSTIKELQVVIASRLKKAMDVISSIELSEIEKFEIRELLEKEIQTGITDFTKVDNYFRKIHLKMKQEEFETITYDLLPSFCLLDRTELSLINKTLYEAINDYLDYMELQTRALVSNECTSIISDDSELPTESTPFTNGILTPNNIGEA